MNIDRDKLAELASAPNSTTKTICAGLGIEPHILYYEMKKDSSLKAVYDEARNRGAMAGSGATASAGAAPRSKQKKAAKKKTLTATPPPQWSCQERSWPGVF